MKEHPILFSPDMVKAILDSRKTQTRRVVKIRPGDCFNTRRIIPGVVCDDDGEYYGFCSEEHNYKCPYGKPGDHLWVRETWWKCPYITPKMWRDGADTWPSIVYDADCTDADREQWKEWGWIKKPSIFLPKNESRITLEIVNVRVERVGNISAMDCIAEGIKRSTYNLVVQRVYDETLRFKLLWDSINKKRGFGWDKNPWVWVIEFKKGKP